jgi:hypothetical protein
MEILFLNWLTVAIAVSAFTYSNILTEPGHILENLKRKIEANLPEKISKPLIGCQYCVSGQWALWFYLYLCFIDKSTPYVWWVHIWFILQTIFLAGFFTYLYYEKFK